MSNTGTSFAPMLASLLTYAQWLLANPTAGGVGAAAAAGCPVSDELTRAMTGFAGEGWRLAPSPVIVSSLGIPATLTPGETTVTLSLRASRAAESVVDTAGQVASAVAALPSTSFDVGLALGGDGRWRLCSVRPSTGDSADPAGQSLF